jgi:hypothetical protein
MERPLSLNPCHGQIAHILDPDALLQGIIDIDFLINESLYAKLLARPVLELKQLLGPDCLCSHKDRKDDEDE